MVTAAPQDQWRLLDVQDQDTKLAQLAHRRRTLPEHAEVDRLAGEVARLQDAIVMAQARAEDVQREVAKAESDVEQVRSRAARNQARMDAGQGSAKDLQALAHENQSLAARQSALEDVELEVMERLEAAQGEVADLRQRVEAQGSELEAAEARRAQALADLDQSAATEQQARDSAAAGVPAALLELYERIRAKAGTGAARLLGRRCEGCRLELNTVEIGRFRAAPEDQVLRCEECDRILVRVPESSL